MDKKDKKNGLFPKVKNSIDNFLFDQEGNIPRNKILAVGSMMILLGIIFVLCAFFYTNYFKLMDKSRLIVARTYVLETLPSALESFKIDVGDYPADDQGLEALTYPPVGIEHKWKGPYISKDNLRDPWGNDYLYTYPSTQGDGDFDVWSLGKDGIPSADDITNWRMEN